jgi:hypothetical protein
LTIIWQYKFLLIISENKIVEIPSDKQQKCYFTEIEKLHAENDLEKLIDEHISQMKNYF